MTATTGQDGLALVARDAERAGARLLRAWPRTTDHVLVEVDRDGAVQVGQWCADPARAATVGARTPGALVHGRLVLQPAGADRRLRGLATLLRAPGSTLVAHRPERRAVVRTGAGTFVKVLRAERLPSVAAAARAVAGLPVRTPRVLSVDTADGHLTTAALPGRPLHELLGTPAAVPACRTLGAALAALHHHPVPAGTPVHDAAAEAAVLTRWAGLAATWGVGDAGSADEAVAGLLDGPPGPPVLLHRDLHDRQVLVDDDGGVGLLDFDLLAAGEAALDLANLLAHLDLRQAQGTVADAAPLRAAVLEGYRPTDDVLARVPVHEAATHARLAAVYAFRPGRPVS